MTALRFAGYRKKNGTIILWHGANGRYDEVVAWETGERIESREVILLYSCLSDETGKTMLCSVSVRLPMAKGPQ